MFTKCYSIIILVFFVVVISANGQDALVVSSYLSGYKVDKSYASDYNEYTITNMHQSSRSKAYHYYLQQKIYGLDLYEGVMSLHLDKNNKIFKINDQFHQNINGRIQTITADQNVLEPIAVLNAIKDEIGFAAPKDLKLLESDETPERKRVYAAVEISQEPIPFKLVYALNDQNEFRLCWDLNILTIETGYWWSLKVDAADGKIIDKVNWTVSCDFGHIHQKACKTKHFGVQKFQSEKSNVSPEAILTPASYRVFPLGVESPNHGNSTLEVSPHNTDASPYGWHDTNASAGAEYTITRGNNVLAQEDQNGNNGTGASADGGVGLNFDFPANFNNPPAQNLNPALTNLFYWNNVMHDVWYQYGFTEAAGNFQENNYGNGGIANDYVLADGLDGSGTNNANFSTPTDGSRPRMQMFLWSAPSSSITFTVTAPASISGTYTAAKANFGPSVYNISGQIALAEPIDACTALTNPTAISGKIAVLDRGVCEFGLKCLNAQNAGAIAVIVCNNVSGAPISMAPGAQGANVTIPCIMLSQANCNTIKVQINNGVDITMIGTGGLQIDGDFDNGIIAHEYGHGISIRLTGGAGNSSCLNNAEQMGEGWSDWFGLMLTMKPGDMGSSGKGIGTYALGQPPTGNGIRTYRYSTDMSINPHTYNAIISLAAPHGVGSVWCAMLWELTWDLMDAYGFDNDFYNGAGGNNIAMALVTEALKLQPCSPGFVDGRNAILAADDLLYDGIHKCLIWKAFAKRGLGFSASQGTSTSKTDGTQAFDMPVSCCNEIYNNKNAGTGSLRDALSCALAGDTLYFAPYMANKTISLTGGLTINKNIYIHGPDLSTPLSITSSDTATPFTIGNHTVELKNLNFIPVNNTQARAISNNGILNLINVVITDQMPGNTPSLLNNGTLDMSGLIIIK